MNLINLSVIIPMHNGIGFIDRAIQSIIDVASDLEIVIVENGSSDGSFEYLQMNYPKLSIHSIPDASKTKARNLGAKFATREVITFLDQDDEFTSGRVNPIYLENAKNGAVIIGTQEFLDSENSLMPPYLKDSYKNGRPNYHPISALISRETFIEVGGFNEDYELAEDFELWTRILRSNHAPVYVNEYFIIRHFHSSNESHQVARASKELLRLVRGHVDAQRSAK